MRVCFISPFGERRGGSDEVLLGLLSHLDRARLEPRVILLEQGGLAADIAALGVPVASTPGGRVRNPGHLAVTVVRIARLLRSQRPRLVVNWLSTAQVYGAPAVRLARIPAETVWWQHDLPTVRGYGRRRALDRLAAVLPARAILANSAAVGAAQRRLSPRRPVAVVPPGIEPPANDRQASPPDVVANTGAKPVVGLVGRLVPWKGAHRLVAAIASLRDRGIEARGLIVGGTGHDPDLAYEARVAEAIRDQSLEGQVTITGWVDDPRPYIQAMDVLVNASDVEPFGLTLLEAMAVGTPVVAFAAGGPAEIIEDGVSGILVPSPDADALASALGALIGDEQLRVRLSEGALARFHERYTAARMARDFEDVVRGMLE